MVIFLINPQAPQPPNKHKKRSSTIFNTNSNQHSNPITNPYLNSNLHINPKIHPNLYPWVSFSVFGERGNAPPLMGDTGGGDWYPCRGAGGDWHMMQS